MKYVTKESLIKQLDNIPDDTRICIRCKTPYSGDSLYFDLTVNEYGDLIILSSDGLNLTIDGEMELINE